MLVRVAIGGALAQLCRRMYVVRGQLSTCHSSSTVPGNSLFQLFNLPGTLERFLHKAELRVERRGVSLHPPRARENKTLSVLQVPLVSVALGSRGQTRSMAVTKEERERYMRVKKRRAFGALWGGRS